MAYTIDFHLPKNKVRPAANRNWHDPFYWDFSYTIAKSARQECEALEADWNTQKVIHDIYELYNAPHIDIEERRQNVSRYIMNKQLSLIHQNKARYPDFVEDMLAKKRRDREEAEKSIDEGLSETVSWVDLVSD